MKGKGRFSVVWTGTAQRDNNAIIDYIAEDSPKNAMNVFSKIRKKAESLKDFPARGRVVPELKSMNIERYRELILPPWRIIYEIQDKTIYVHAVLDARRNLEDLLLNRFLNS